MDWVFDEEQLLSYNNPVFIEQCKRKNKNFDELNTGWVKQIPLDKIEETKEEAIAEEETDIEQNNDELSEDDLKVLFNDLYDADDDDDDNDNDDNNNSNIDNNSTTNDDRNKHRPPFKSDINSNIADSNSLKDETDDIDDIDNDSDDIFNINADDIVIEPTQVDSDIEPNDSISSSVTNTNINQSDTIKPKMVISLKNSFSSSNNSNDINNTNSPLKLNIKSKSTGSKKIKINL